MKKYIIAILIVLMLLPVITVNADSFTDAFSVGMWGGSIGVPKWFNGLDDLLQYLENESWKYESPTTLIYQKDQIDYLKQMDKELFLPVGYSKEDIERIKIDKVLVSINLSGGKYLHYWFTPAGGVVETIPGTNVGTPTKFWLLPGKTGVYDIPEVYNIYEADESEDIDIDDPVECGDVEAVPDFE